MDILKHAGNIWIKFLTYRTPNVFPFEMPPLPTLLNDAQAYSNNGSTYVITYVMNNPRLQL